MTMMLHDGHRVIKLETWDIKKNSFDEEILICVLFLLNLDKFENKLKRF